VNGKSPHILTLILNNNTYFRAGDPKATGFKSSFPLQCWAGWRCKGGLVLKGRTKILAWRGGDYSPGLPGFPFYYSSLSGCKFGHLQSCLPCAADCIKAMKERPSPPFT
jgi:hypothetical protein